MIILSGFYALIKVKREKFKGHDYESNESEMKYVGP